MEVYQKPIIASKTTYGDTVSHIFQCSICTKNVKIDFMLIQGLYLLCGVLRMDKLFMTTVLHGM